MSLLMQMSPMMRLERDVHIQYFTTSGEMVIDQDAGVRIHGGRQRNRSVQESLETSQ